MFKTQKTINRNQNSFSVIKPKYELDFDIVDLAIKKYFNPKVSQRIKEKAYQKFIHKAIEIAVDNALWHSENFKQYRDDLIQDTFLKLHTITHARGLFSVVGFLISEYKKNDSYFIIGDEVVEEAISRMNKQSEPEPAELEFDELIEVTLNKLQKMKSADMTGQELFFISCLKSIFKNEKDFNQY